MKKFLLMLMVSVSSIQTFAQALGQEVLSYSNGCANPTSDNSGVVIKTKYPFSVARYMPTVIVEGQNFGNNQTIGLIISWYVYSNGNNQPEYFYSKTISSYGAYAPETHIFNDGGFVSIFLKKGVESQYCISFKVRSWLRTPTDSGADASWYTGWSGVTTDVSPNQISESTKLTYKNTFGDATVKNLTVANSNSSTFRLVTTNIATDYFTDFTTNYNAAERFSIQNGATKMFGNKAILNNGLSQTYLNDYYDLVFSTGVTSPVLSNVRMLINNIGNIGIGTTTPNSRLDVKDGKIIAGTRTAVNGATVLESQYDQAGINGSLSVLGTNASSGGWIMGYGISPKANASNTFISSTPLPLGRSAIMVESDLSFMTGSQQSTPIGGDITLTERMKITNTGNVGIGTTAPISKLDVFGGALGGGIGNKLEVARFVSNNGNSSLLRIFNNRFVAGNDWYSSSTRIQQTIDATDMGYLEFNPKDSPYGLAFGGYSGETMRLTDAGNVGIGTKNPTAKLEIASTTGSGFKLSGLSQVNVQAGPTRTLGVNDAGEVIIAGTNSSLTSKLTDINGYKTFFTDAFSTTTTQPKRFEIARIFTDVTNWSSTSPVEIELLETSYASGASRKYRIHFGYLNKDGVINQIEVSDITASSGAAGINNFQLIIGTPVVDGNLKYLPIYADVRYYTTLRALIKTARPTTPNKTGGVTGTIYVNTEPTGTDILEFVPNNNTVFSTAGGNSIFNGNIGIGVKTPSVNSKLHILGDHGNTSSILQLSANANGAQTGEISLNTWVSEPNISWEGTGIGANINNWGLTRFNTGLSSSYIRFIPHPTNGYMQFSTIAGNGTKYDKVMTLVNDKVGIGTDTPTEKLSVLHNGANTPFGAMGIDVTSFSTAANAADSYYFRVRDIGAGNNIPFIIKGSGAVGIGTTSPISTLQTNGTITIGSGTNPSAVATMQLKADGVSPIANRLTYGTDGTGWKFAIGKNQGGTITDQFVIQDNGNVSIGTTTPPAGYKLAIAGDMIAERVVVKLQANWPDYVFKTGYSLRPLSEVENFVKANNHLPDVPSEAEVKAKGIDVEQMNATLLKKVEELTLYMIELQKQNDVLKKLMDSLDKK